MKIRTYSLQKNLLTLFDLSYMILQLSQAYFIAISKKTNCSVQNSAILNSINPIDNLLQNNSPLLQILKRKMGIHYNSC